MPGDARFSFPAARRMPWWGWCVAIAAHLSLLLILIYAHATVPVFAPHRDDGLRHDTAATMSLPSAPHRQPRDMQRAIGRVVPAPVPAPAADLPPPTPVALSARVPATVVDTPPLSGALQPHYGTGRLWVEPLRQTPRQIARTLTGKTDAQLNDSAVTAMVQAYLNQMAEETRDHPETLPSWTTKIAGKTVGVDQRWIYLGPLKVPTALLALLPIKVQANPTEGELNRRRQAMRSDLMEAARRAVTYDDFKEAVKELHAESERQREFKKNQAIPPASPPE